MGWGKGHEILLALMLSEKIKPSHLGKLLTRKPLDVFEAKGVDALARELGVGEGDLAAVAEARERAPRLAATLAARGYGMVALCDEAYPRLLREIANPPPALFLRGSLIESDREAIAIVGSRRPSLAGVGLARDIARDLGHLGFTVVSGLARGIDTAAHRGALEAGGRTIAVLGSGVDVVYPPENADLAESIAGNGAVVSELLPATRPLKPNFPRRNRLISGLAMGTLVVEAGEKSGALITAAFALDQNRSVYAVPGSPAHARSRGANRLLKEGARLVESAEDIVEDIRPQLDGPSQAGRRRAMPSLGLEAASGLSLDEAQVAALLSDAPVHVDELSRHLKMEAHKVLGLLLALETRGFARSLSGKFYVKSELS
jgi:DNA processing protein